MINCTNVAAGQAETYYRADDYYSKDNNPPAAWYGKGAEALGLDEAHAARDFGDLLRGKLPNGEQIPGGQGGKRRAGTDLTISAPKSVSIAALVNGDQRVIEAHNLAVERALHAVEQRIQAREVVDGQTRAVTTGNMIARTVLHDTSRTGDPNLHTHCVIINATQTEDGRWKAIENREIFRMQRELDMVYKSELALGLSEAGYQLRATKNGFELAQIDDRLIAEFSKRKEAVDQALAERGSNRETASAEEREKAALNTRDRKVHYDRDQLAQTWRERAQELGLDNSIPAGTLPGVQREPQEAAKEGLEYAVNHLGEREQAWRDIDLQSATMSTAWGAARWSDVVASAKEAESSGAVIRKQDGTLTTPAARQREAAMLQLEERGRGAFQPLASDLGALAQALDQTSLNEKQRAAVEMLMSSTNQVVGIQGRAGVGKTTLLNTFREQAEASGWRIEGLAPSHSAVQALADAGIQGKTLQSWEAQGCSVNQKTILLVDESSLVSVRQMTNLMLRAGMSDARVIVVGDTGQYQSVDAGKAFAQLQANRMQTAIVDKMLRQQVDELRLVASLAAEGKGAEALAKLGDGVTEITDRSARHGAIARDYAALGADERKETLILTGSNADRQSINGLVREALGLAGQGRQVEVFERGDLTSAQMRRAVSYRAGDAIRFEKDYRSLDAVKGEIWKVSRVEGNEVVLARDGQERRMRPAELSGKGLTVGRIVEREVAAGDRLRVTGDIPALVGKETLRNGQRATVLALQGDKLEVKIDGRAKSVMVSASKALNLDHGYAATGHSAQGLGASRVFLERDSHCRTASERQFYTDVTRVKHELRVYTDDREQLAKSVERKVDKTQALEHTGAEQPGEKVQAQVIEQVQQVVELVDDLKQIASRAIDYRMGL